MAAPVIPRFKEGITSMHDSRKSYHYQPKREREREKKTRMRERIRRRGTREGSLRYPQKSLPPSRCESRIHHHRHLLPALDPSLHFPVDGLGRAPVKQHPSSHHLPSPPLWGDPPTPHWRKEPHLDLSPVVFDLNDLPDPIRDAAFPSDEEEEEEEVEAESSFRRNAATNDKGKGPESISTADNDDSSFSTIVTDETDGDGGWMLFGFLVGGDSRCSGKSEPTIVTHQFFPMKEGGRRGISDGCCSSVEGPLRRAHWVGSTCARHRRRSPPARRWRRRGGGGEGGPGACRGTHRRWQRR